MRGVVWVGVLAEEEGAGDRGTGEEEASESWRRWDRRGGADWNGTCWSAVGRAGTSIGFMKWASCGSTKGRAVGGCLRKRRERVWSGEQKRGAWGDDDASGPPPHMR